MRQPFFIISYYIQAPTSVIQTTERRKDLGYIHYVIEILRFILLRSEWQLVSKLLLYTKRKEGVSKFSSLDFLSADNADYADFFLGYWKRRKISVISAICGWIVNNDTPSFCLFILHDLRCIGENQVCFHPKCIIRYLFRWRNNWCKHGNIPFRFQVFLNV